METKAIVTSPRPKYIRITDDIVSKKATMKANAQKKRMVYALGTLDGLSTGLASGDDLLQHRSRFIGHGDYRPPAPASRHFDWPPEARTF